MLVKFQKLNQFLTGSNDLTLITDGWTNTRGDHIVNFLVKSPTQRPMFYKSINTTGIIQNTENVSKAILDVIEVLLEFFRYAEDLAVLPTNRKKIISDMNACTIAKPLKE